MKYSALHITTIFFIKMYLYLRYFTVINSLKLYSHYIVKTEF